MPEPRELHHRELGEVREQLETWHPAPRSSRAGNVSPNIFDPVAAAARWAATRPRSRTARPPLFGCVLVLLSAIGVLRFPDALARMHALTKASTLGVALVAIGSVFVLPTANDITSAIGAALLQLLTLPISASLLARATYHAHGIPSRLDVVDERANRRLSTEQG